MRMQEAKSLCRAIDADGVALDRPFIHCFNRECSIREHLWYEGCYLCDAGDVGVRATWAWDEWRFRTYQKAMQVVAERRY